jgi:type I restriction enzyme M protein
MVLKKSNLYSSLWKSCDELRGGMDASQYKDYILTLLFVKYVSDKAKSDPNSLIDVPAGDSFDDMLAAKGDEEIGDRFNKRQAGRGQRPAQRHRPSRLQRRGEARQGQGDAGPPLQVGDDLQRSRRPGVRAPRATTCSATPTST